MAHTPGPGPPPRDSTRDGATDLATRTSVTQKEGAAGALPHEGRLGDQPAQENRGTMGGDLTEPAVQTTATARQIQPQPTRMSTTQERAGTWSDRVRAHTPTVENITEDIARKSHMLEGVWNPMHVKQLMATLMVDWASPNEVGQTAEEADMCREALVTAKASCDESVRAWTARESTIMLKYLRGELELPHPPNFLKEILVGEYRAMIEDMHEAYFNASLTAAVPATVMMTKNVAHAAIFKELFLANTDKRTGHAMMRAFQRDVKRISYDGIQTIQVVFYSKRAADRWAMKALRLQKAVIILQDTERKMGEESTGVFTPVQLELQYAVRVYGGRRMSLTALARAFAQFAGAKVLDVEYARTVKTEIYDNRYQTIRFAQRGCPEALQGVTKIRLGEDFITIHHFQ
ncbi:hypothetical protein PF008_g19480, partial [Phytophthora fragariae]